MWALLIVAGLHIVAAFVHLFYYRDGVMRRMLPGELATGVRRQAGPIDTWPVVTACNPLSQTK
jgi:hypothetical protein